MEAGDGNAQFLEVWHRSQLVPDIVVQDAIGGLELRRVGTQFEVDGGHVCVAVGEHEGRETEKFVDVPEVACVGVEDGERCGVAGRGVSSRLCVRTCDRKKVGVGIGQVNGDSYALR